MGDAITSATSEEDGALRGRNILLGVTGSVAAVKAPALVRQLVEIDQANVQVLLTSGGRHFWDRAAEYDEYSSASGSSIESSNQLPPTSCGTGNSTDHSRLAASTAVSDATSTPPSSAVPPGPGWIPPSVQVHCM
jgi:Flavoprotein